jgi:hypothetical protein
MKHTKLTALVLSAAFLTALSLPVSQHAQCVLACNDTIRVSVNPDPDFSCRADLNLDAILEGTPDISNALPCGAASARVEIRKGNSLVRTATVTTMNQMFTFDAALYLGQSLTSKVTLLDVGGLPINACWDTLILEDKARPRLDCSVFARDPKTGAIIAQGQSISLDCTFDLTGISAPVANDNCDAASRVNLVNEIIRGDVCAGIVITKVYVATDASGLDSDPCTITITLRPVSVQFPDDITWTCEQYAFSQGIVDAKPLHQHIFMNAVALDRSPFCCIPGLDGDDVIGTDPYQPATNWWTDAEDLDVPLDPRFDDDIDNPVTDNDPLCHTTTAESDNLIAVANFSTFGPPPAGPGCPYLITCSNPLPNGHVETFEVLNWGAYVPPSPIPANHPIRGLEDADVLAATGSGVPNVFGAGNCSYAVTWSDQKLAACEFGDTTVVFKILRTWTVLNWCTGSIQTDIQVIKVLDKKAPELDFSNFSAEIKAEKFTSGDHQECGSAGLIDAPAVSDNCTGVIRLRAYTPVGEGIPLITSGAKIFGFRIPPPYLPLGQHIIIFEATDGCGNMTTMTQRIRVVDDIPPVAICREITQVALGSDGLTKVAARFFDEGSYDNCAQLHFKVLKMEEFTCNKLNIDKQGEKDAGREWFDDEVIFCCEDIRFDATGKPIPINIILRVYDTDPGAGAVPTVRSSGASNLSHSGQATSLNNNRYNDCMIQVLVEDKIRPDCTAPADLWITCRDLPDNLNFNDPDLMNQRFGSVAIWDNCPGSTAQPRVISNLDVCGSGTIYRDWSVTDRSGNRGLRTCRQTIMVTRKIDYDIRIPSDFSGQCHEFFEDSLKAESRGCDLIGITYEDKVLNLNPGGECRKIIRTWTFIDWCDYDGFSRPLRLDRRDINGDGMFGDGFSDNPVHLCDLEYLLKSDGTNLYYGFIGTSQIVGPSIGYYTYEQHLKIFDSTPPSLVAPDTTTFCGGELAENPCTGLVRLSPKIFEVCTPNEVLLQYRIDLHCDGQFDIPTTGRTTGSINRRLPIGRHIVRFWATDGCGNTNELDVPFTINDCKTPSVICINGLSAELMMSPSGQAMISLSAKDFDASSSDFCSPVTFRINRVEDIAPDSVINSNDYIRTLPPHDTIIARCKDLGRLIVQVWAVDAAGNSGFCATFVEITDHMRLCGRPRPALGGKVANEDNEAVEDVRVELSTGERALTGNDGQYNFAVVPGGDYTITPSRDDNPLNGVTTFDLVLISKHILNVSKLNSPYKIIAADANNSGTVTTLDVVALRKLILRISDRLPNNTSWRFVERSYQFPSPANPWATQFPEVRNYNNLTASQLSADFMAIKVGDVNGSATANSLVGIDVRSFNGQLELQADDRRVEAGEVIKVSLTANRDVQGYQFTLGVNGKLAELQGVESGQAKEGNVHIAGQDIATSWNEREATAGHVVYTVVLRAKASAHLSELLTITSDITAAEAYGMDGSLLGVVLDFGRGATAAHEFSLEQNSPNPYKGETIIGFTLPEAGTATLTISDASGRVMRQVEGQYSAGRHQVTLRASELGARGVLYYELTTSTHQATRKMVIVE